MGNKIMAHGDLEDIVTRLNCCHSILTALWMEMGEGDVKATLVEALCGCADLLNSICRDLEADICAAKDIPDGGTAA